MNLQIHEFIQLFLQKMKKKMDVRSIIMSSTFESAKISRNNLINIDNDQSTDYQATLNNEYDKQNILGRNIYQVCNQPGRGAINNQRNKLSNPKNNSKFEQIGTDAYFQSSSINLEKGNNKSLNQKSEANQSQRRQGRQSLRKRLQRLSEQSQEDMTDIWNQIKTESKQQHKDNQNRHQNQQQNLQKQSQESITLDQQQLAYCFGISNANLNRNTQSIKNAINDRKTEQKQIIKQTEKLGRLQEYHKQVQIYRSKQDLEIQQQGQEFQDMWNEIQKQKIRYSIKNSKNADRIIQVFEQAIQHNNLQLQQKDVGSVQNNPKTTSKESPKRTSSQKKDEVSLVSSASEKDCQYTILIKPLSKIQMEILGQIVTAQSKDEQYLLYSVHYKQFNRRKFVTSKFNEGGSSYFAMRIINDQDTRFCLYSIEMGNQILQCYYQKSRYYFVLPKTEEKIGCLYYANKRGKPKEQENSEQNYQLRIYDCYQDGYLPLEAQINVFDGFIAQFCYCDTSIIPIGSNNRLKKRSELQQQKLSMVINKKKGKLTTYLPIQKVKQSPFNCSLQLQEGKTVFMVGMMDDEGTKFLIKIAHPISILIGMATAVARISYINKYRF